MKLPRLSRWVVWIVFYPSVILGAVLLFSGTAGEITGLAVAGGVLMGLAVIFHLLFYRCSSCGRYLDRSSGDFCPHCGKRLD